MAKSKLAKLLEQFDDEPPPKVRRPSRPHKAANGDPLACTADEVDTYEVGRRVPNVFPRNTNLPYRLAIIGEAPGEDEERMGIPFIGASGRFLDQILSRANILRDGCFIGNVCQHRPPKNDLTKFTGGLRGVEVREGLAQLRRDLAEYRPNLCLLLGKTALWAAKGTMAISDWRGSLFMAQDLIGPASELYEVKCLASYHPAYCLRQYEWTPVLMFDIRRAATEARTPTIIVPKRDLLVDLSFADLERLLVEVLDRKLPVSPDIEGGVRSMSCISLAVSPTKSFIVPFTKINGTPYWSVEEEVRLWSLLSAIMADAAIPKVFQNGLYDRFVLQYSYNLLVRNASDDTMLKFWELYCELEKSLGFQCSILTQEQFYKFERKADNERVFFTYCCKDSANTFEINEKLTKMLDPAQTAHYKRNCEALNAFLYMELRGLRYDEAEAESRLAEVQDHVYTYQEKLDNIAKDLGAINGLDFGNNLEAQVRSICCYVRDPAKPKQAFLDAGFDDVVPLLGKPNLTASERGRISILCKETMNTKSPRFKDFLYETCALPTQWKKDPKTKEMRPTTDYEALLKLSKKHDHPALKVSLELSRLRTRAQMLTMASIDGRVHCAYNEVGSETGRVTCYKSIIPAKGKFVGMNMQTMPDAYDLEDEEHPLTQGMRDLILADEGCFLGKCDLKGADGWTVGSYLAMLGDPTMLDDLKFGLKPAQIIAYILKHGAASVAGKTRAELKEMCKEIAKEDWEYFVSKQGIWGTCYTMGPRKLAERVFIESEGKVNLSETEAREFQRCITVRYKIHILHNWMTRQINAMPYPFRLTASNGFTRRFFGRKDEVLGEALAHLPQVYTTHATNTAAFRLWTDPENRIKLTDTACRLIVEPMHQVHDELLVQFRQENVDFARRKIKEWFNNTIVIANQTLVIPYDGAYGTNWAMDKESKIGDL